MKISDGIQRLRSCDCVEIRVFLGESIVPGVYAAYTIHYFLPTFN